MEAIGLLGVEPVHRCCGPEADDNGFATAEIQPVESCGASRTAFAVNPRPYLHDVAVAQIPLDHTSADQRMDLRRRRHSALALEQDDHFGVHTRRVKLALGQR